MQSEAHFLQLLAHSARLIKQATEFLNIEEGDEADEGKGNTRDDNRQKCLQVIESSNEAMLGVTEKILENRRLKKKTMEEKKSKSLSLISQRNTLYRKFDSIIGSQDAKQALFENIVLPLSLCASERQKIFQGVLAGGGNVLLYGPPGNGKTCLAQAAACEADAEFFSVRPSDILSKYQGESEKYISNLFSEAKLSPRSVIFLDEFDSIASARGGSMEDCAVHRRLLAELLLQLSLINSPSASAHTAMTNGVSQLPSNSHSSCRVDDEREKPIHSGTNDTGASSGTSNMIKSLDSGCNQKAEISSIENNALVVVAATNRFEDLDEAVIRRFDAKVWGIEHSIGAPGAARIAAYTIGWSGSEIQTLCREAAMTPLREIAKSTSAPDETSRKRKIEVEKIRPVVVTDFDVAYQSLIHEPEDPTSVEIDGNFSSEK